MRLGQGSLGPDDPLGDRRLGDEEGASDLVGRQSAEESEGQADPGIPGQDGMTGGEHQPEQVVADIVVGRRLEGGHRHCLGDRELAAQFLVLAIEHRPPGQEVHGPMLGGPHEPRSRIARDAGLGPLLERSHEGVLSEILGDADVSHDTCEPGDEPGRFDPPDRLDRGVRLRRHRPGPSSIARMSSTACSPSTRARSSGHRRPHSIASAHDLSWRM